MDLMNISPEQWVGWYRARMGWTEFDHDQELSKFWPLVHLDYKTVIGLEHAWCSLAAEAALQSCGLKGTGNAAAASWVNWGDPCSYIYGAFLPIRHVTGGHHITVFLYWIDQRNKIAACVGGNQNNGIRVSAYNLSGNLAGHDEVVSGPRWPHGVTQVGLPHPVLGASGTMIGIGEGGSTT